MFGNFNNYQPQFQNPYQDRLNSMQANYMQHTEITRVNGENGAKAYPLAPNSSVLLLDENSPIVWLAQSDGAGYKTVAPYTITPYQPEAPADVQSLEQRIAKLEELIYVKSDTEPASKAKKPAADKNVGTK